MKTKKPRYEPVLNDNNRERFIGDADDEAIARERLAEIAAHPERVLRGATLEAQMKQWES